MEKFNFAGEDSVPSINLRNYSISFISGITSVAEYYHYCYKIIISLDNSFEGIIDGQAYYGLQGFIVNQTIMHSYFAPETNVLVSFVEPDSLLGRQIQVLLENKAWININSVLTEEELGQVLPANYMNLSNEALIPYVNNFLESFLKSRDSESVVIDKRIGLALEFIGLNLHQSLYLKDVSKHIGLSDNKTSDLFFKQVGVSFSQYVWWQRISKTIAFANNEESKLSEASQRFGFTDQMHFNQRFRRIFGMSPIGLIRYCRVLL